MSGDRHHRQQLLPGWGESGQERIANATALVVGVGALGCVSAELLSRAGVGRLILVDRDTVELTNLQRQLLYAESDLDKPKAAAAAERLRAIDSSLCIEPVVEHLDGELASELARDVDLIIDGTDNFETRYVLNDAAVAFNKPLIYGGAVAAQGTVMPVLSGRGPCLRCLRDELPTATDTCDTAGVLGPIVAWVGARQAALAMRAIIEGPDAMPIRLESMDAWTGRSTSIELTDARDPACPCCAGRVFEHLDAVRPTTATALCGRNSVQIVRGGRSAIDLRGLARRLESQGEFLNRGGLLVGSLRHEDGLSLTVFPDGRAIVHGTEDSRRARGVYDRYIGA